MELIRATRPGPVKSRPDLGRRALFALLGAVSLGATLALLARPAAAPGSPLLQGAAIAGALLLLTPFAFSIAKRSGLSVSPPAWFVAHVLASVLGVALVALHAGAGKLLSPPGALLLALGFLVVQGLLARALLGHRLAARFGARPAAFFANAAPPRAQLAALIERKRALLARLDAGADEALFSPHLGHWLRRPWLSLRYARLAAGEAHVLGARRQAGALLAGWRRLHLAVAALFLLGLLAHVVLVTFFAGYVAGPGPVYWWHLSAWGGGG